MVHGVWANQLMASDAPKFAHFEIRQNVSIGNGGALIASGELPVDVMLTGRTAFVSYSDTHLRCVFPEPILLPAGRYWLSLAPVGFGHGNSFASETSGLDEPPAGDPNPPPAGNPIRDFNAFIDYPKEGLNFSPINDDFSYGIGTLARTRGRWRSPTRSL